MNKKKWTEWDDMCKYPETYQTDKERKQQRDKFILRRYLESQITIEELCKCYNGVCEDCPLNHNCAIQHACGEYENESFC